MSTTRSDPIVRTPEEIWRMLDRSIERQAEIERLLEETAAQSKETDRLVKERAAQSKETDRLVKETAAQMKETDRRLRKAEDLFTTQWGRLVESFVEGDLEKLLRARGLEVRSVSSRHRMWSGSDRREVDLIATGSREVVAVEVKTTLRPADVNRFLDLLAHPCLLRRVRDRRLYGAVAYIHRHEGTGTYARRKGLFVIRATGSSASIVNPPEFQPHDFS